MFKTDSFLGNKNLSLNQNAWRDHATMQQNTIGQKEDGSFYVIMNLKLCLHKMSSLLFDQTIFL